MALTLKQSTAVDVLIGPFVDITDGATAETGESPSVKLSKNGQALAAKNDVTTPVHDADGYYNCEFDATDTNTVGTLVLTVAASANALPVRHEFQVVEENVYDMVYASSGDLGTTIDAIETDTQNIQSRLPAALVGGRIDANASAISGDATAADKLEASIGTIVTGTVDDTVLTPTTTQFEADDITEATADHYNGRIVIFTSGVLVQQAAEITDYQLNSGRGRFTITTRTEAPGNNDTFVIV